MKQSILHGSAVNNIYKVRVMKTLHIDLTQNCDVIKLEDSKECCVSTCVHVRECV